MNNNLNYLKDFTFYNLKNLVSINLDNNRLEFIEMMTFDSLINLRKISLRNNSLRFIYNDVFSYINQDSNLIDLSKNKISLILPNSFKKTKTLRIDYESILNTNTLPIQTLDLSHKNISIVISNSISGQFIRLDLKNNIITKFEPDSFIKTPSLSIIDLSKNLLNNLDFNYAFSESLNFLLEINFESNKILAINSNFFEKFQNLKLLSIALNNLHSIKNTYFLNLENLEKLNISFNQILTIETGSFDRLITLKILDLKNNLIYDVKGNLFSQLSSLEWLSLSTNKIELIENLTFVGLSQIKYLDLSFNEIKFLSRNVFDAIVLVQHLNLNSNEIAKLNKSISNMKNLEYLDLSHNILNGTLEHQEFANTLNLAGIDLSQNIFSQILVNFSKFINLKVIKIRNTSLNSFGNISSCVGLEEVDFSESLNLENSSIQIQNYKNMKTLRLKSTNLKDLDFLKNLHALESLDISNSNLLGKQNIAKYFANKPSVKKLEISNVSLFSLKKIKLLIDNLEYLDLSLNNLTMFELAYIQKMNKLEYLDISFNQIKSFNDILRKDNVVDYFQFYTKNLVYANFTKAFDEKLSGTIFHFGKKIETAVLSQLSLKEFSMFCIEEEKYEECELKRLYFDFNQIDTIKNTDLMYLENLEYLNLANNKIDSIEVNAFKNLINLETLILTKNNLKIFDQKKLFNCLVNLKYLNLSSNSIPYLESYFFDNLFKLEVIDLSFNKIYLIDNFAFNKLANLKDLHVDSNENMIKLHLFSFSNLDLIENIHLSKSILSDENKFILKRMVGIKNSKFKKNVLKRKYYKSLNLLAKNDYDCQMTLSFIIYNIHFNLKSDNDFFNYFIRCEHLFFPKSNFQSYFIIDDHFKYLI